MRIVQGPKYDLRVNPIYQVDWQNEASGKRVGATKRRVRWRFGFSNRTAVDQGLTGVDCRGEEHEVVLVWSLTSGKRLVIVDGQEVHFSTGRRTDSKFETSWSMFGGHIFKIIAHAAPPLFNEPGFRQFDLQLDGMSFHSFPKIFELGLRSARRQNLTIDTTYSERSFATPPVAARTNREAQPRQQPHGPVPITPETPKQQVAEPAREPVRSPPAYEDLLSSSSSSDGNDLLWNSAPQLTYEPQVAWQQQQCHQQSVPVQPQYAQQQQQLTPYQYHQHSPRGVVDEFAPVPPPPRTFQDVSKEILSAYTPDPSIPALTYTPHYSDQVYQSSSGAATKEDFTKSGTSEKSQKAVLKPTMEPISIVEMEERDQPPVSEMEKALKTLVNLDDITETLETPEQVKTVRKKENNQPPKSKPLPPATPEWNLGLRPALADIKQHAQQKAAPKKEIMRTHAFDPAAVQAGMMVIYGATLPGATGFSAGVHQSHYNGYYPQQQQRMYAAY